MSLPQTVLITAEQIESLEKLQLLASAHQSMLEILADQAVEALGLDRGDDSYDANTLRSIVILGISVDDAVRKIAERRAGAALQQLSRDNEAYRNDETVNSKLFEAAEIDQVWSGLQ